MVNSYDFLCLVAECFNFFFFALLDWAATGSALPAELSRDLVVPSPDAFDSSGSLAQRISSNLLYRHSRVLLGEYSVRLSAHEREASGANVAGVEESDAETRRLVRRPLPECASDTRQWLQPSEILIDRVAARHIRKRIAHSLEHSHELRLDWKRVRLELALRIAHFISRPYASFANFLIERFSPSETRAHDLRYPTTGILNWLIDWYWLVRRYYFLKFIPSYVSCIPNVLYHSWVDLFTRTCVCRVAKRVWVKSPHWWATHWATRGAVSRFRWRLQCFCCWCCSRAAVARRVLRPDAVRVHSWSRSSSYCIYLVPRFRCSSAELLRSSSIELSDYLLLCFRTPNAFSQH